MDRHWSGRSGGRRYCHRQYYRCVEILNVCYESVVRTTVKLGYNELGYNEHSVITNKYFVSKGSFTTQINPVITNPGYNEQIWPVPSSSL